MHFANNAASTYYVPCSGLVLGDGGGGEGTQAKTQWPSSGSLNILPGEAFSRMHRILMWPFCFLGFCQ